MIKYFTKKYIKECKAEEIQIIRRQIRYEEGLSYQQFYEGDYRYYEDAPQKDNIVLVKKDELWQVNVHYWLPIGDQLDEEIVKICKEKEDIKNDFLYDVNFAGKKYLAVVYGKDRYGGDEQIAKGFNINPLIAKIKLLKELLK